MKTKLTLLLLALGLGAALPGVAQGQLGWEWTAAMGRPASGRPYPDTHVYKMIATPDGGAIVSGYYTDYLALGTGRGDTLRATNGGIDGMLVKYTATGRKQWAVAAGSTMGITSGGPLVKDLFQGLYCIVNHDDVLQPPIGTPLPGPGVAWYRYSDTGNFVAAGEFGRGSIAVESIGQDNSYRMVLSGSLTGPSAIGSQRLGRIGGYGDGFVTKLNISGVPLWVKPLTSTGTGGSLILGQAVLPNGNVLIGGKMGGNLTIDATHQFVGNLGFMACYDGATGAVVWARTVSVPVRPLFDRSTGQVYVAGEFTGRLNLDAVVATAPPTKENIFIARFDAVAGRGQSLVFAGGGPEKQELRTLVCQQGVGFTLNGTGIGAADFGPGFGLTGATPTSNVSYVLQVSLQGVPQAFYETPASASPGNVAVDPNGRPFLVTDTAVPVQFGQLPAVVPRGNSEVIIAHVGLLLGTRSAAAQAAGLAVYPNPATAAGGATVVCAWPTGQVRLLDAVGRQVWAGALMQGRAVLPPTLALPPGLYVVQVREAGRTVAQRLLLE